MCQVYNPVLACLITGGIIGFLVLGYLASNNKLKPPLLKPAQVLYTLFSVVVLLFIVGAVGYAIIDETVQKSGWIPRTREIPVYVKAHDWVTGEIKTCVSFASKEKKELGALVCGEDQMLDEHHVLQVKFWGSIATDRNKDWKCVREPASLTCRIQ